MIRCATLAMYWSIQQLREYIGDSYFSIETDSQPLINFHKKQINNKRVMLFKLQDIIPQITEVKHLPRDKNTGPDYLSKHPISSTSKKPINDNDWPQGTETWKIKPQRPPSTFFTQLNAVITRQQAKRLIPAPPLTTSTATYASISSAPATTTSPSPQLFDFSLDRIRKEQMEDTDIIEIFNMVKLNPSKSSFTIKDVVLFKLLPRGKTQLRVPYIPQTLIKDILFTHHNHPLAGHFGVERTWRNIKNKYYWPNMKDSTENYIRSCSKCSKFNIQRRKAPGLLQPIDPPSEVFQVLGLDW
ncbi:unnamed protein product [Didymodactylos carnosus]|uniref:Integrase zinc-binding domain-containing protein n=2 Tax=Didymodactylos carnosus TaxID=1234261 RepID=A0A814MGQ4_9BILA|nr:unnamed protein product [Didymodactylos carnosus]CAF3845109.1 unnamed protein product [Didymodactylos carnosus]